MWPRRSGPPLRLVLAEEALEVEGLEADQRFRSIRFGDEGVRHSLRPEGESAGRKRQAPIADVDGEVPFEHVEPLVLVGVDVPWRAARHGGTFTALVGLAGAFLVGLYLREFGGGGALAAIGGVAILLFFFNLMWTIYVFGAEVTKVYADYLAYGDIAAPSERSAPLAVGAEDGEAAARESDAPESPWRTGIIAFLIGLVTGWAARRRA